MTDRELMRFKSRYDWRKDTPVVSTAGMVEHAVSSASFDTSGAVESLVVEVRELTRIVAFLATRLSPSDARALADEIGFECVGPEAPLYTAPRQWKGLTGDEVNELAAGCHLGNSVQGAIRKAEAKLKEKNDA